MIHVEKNSGFLTLWTLLTKKIRLHKRLNNTKHNFILLSMGRKVHKNFSHVACKIKLTYCTTLVDYVRHEKFRVYRLNLCRVH